MGEFTTIKNNATAEIVEKKSKFIANAYYVESKDEAEEKLKEIRKKYNDARHNCYAYRVLNEETIFEKCSDDGEPSGTAGAPMINILQRNNLCNVLVIVTRYFGGILLGTGGLVRAYSEAMNKSLELTEKVEMEEGYTLLLSLEYKDLELFKYYCKNENINIIKTDYGEEIQLLVELNTKQEEQFMKNKDEFKFKLLNCRKMSKNYIRKIR